MIFSFDFRLEARLSVLVRRGGGAAFRLAARVLGSRVCVGMGGRAAAAAPSIAGDGERGGDGVGVGEGEMLCVAGGGELVSISMCSLAMLSAAVSNSSLLSLLSSINTSLNTSFSRVAIPVIFCTSFISSSIRRSLLTEKRTV